MTVTVMGGRGGQGRLDGGRESTSPWLVLTDSTGTGPGMVWWGRKPDGVRRGEPMWGPSQ